jgi:SAM-dependent methyltransferase
MGPCFKLFAILVALLATAVFVLPPDILKGLSSNVQLGNWQLQLTVTGFCFSGLPQKLLQPERGLDIGGDFDFKTDGDLENDDYTKASIYALLYAMYANAGTVISDRGVPYQFTFNTWGIAPAEGTPPEGDGFRWYPETDPQRHGKAGYTGLVRFPEVIDYLENVTDAPTIVEVGSGTGAGANLITRELIPKANYYAIDMQKAGVETCRQRHGNASNPGLRCVHAPEGVGVGGNQIRDDKGRVMPDNSVDFVIVCETHIADVEIGEEEKAIFKEIHRVLKPGGLFLWGNALPTRVWNQAVPVLEAGGLQRQASLNHTLGAIKARDEDEARVNAYTTSLYGKYPVFKVPWIGEECELVADRLIKNFYRHPGTALYLKMVTGFDSYMHEAYRKIVG